MMFFNIPRANQIWQSESSAEECYGALLKKYQQLQLILCGCVIIHVTIPPTKKKKKEGKMIPT